MVQSATTGKVCSTVLLLAPLWALAAQAEASAPARPAAAPASAPADLRSLDGQAVEGSPALRWKYAEVELEWGFKQGAERLAFDGSIESTHALGAVGKARPLAGDTATTMTGDRAWKSPAAGTARRGIVVPLLYTDCVRGPARTIITVRTASGSFSFQPVDLRHGPILVSELGFFIRAPSPKQAPAPPAPKAHPILSPQDLLKDKLGADSSGKFRGWGKDTPVVYANPTAEPVTALNGAITIPPRSVAAHPGAAQDAAVGWRSPIAGKVSVRAKVVHAHPSGGDGVTWAVVHETTAGRKVLAKGAIPRGGSRAIPAAGDADKLAAVAVEKGDGLLLQMGPGATHECDTTVLELVITEAEGPARVWDLAKDVAGDMLAGNPHADSLGNAGVWHFLALGQSTPPTKVLVMAAPVTFESKAATAREYLDELAAHKLKTIRQRVREHPEQTWEAAVRSLHGGPLPPFPQPPFLPRMSVDVPDANLTALWRIGAWRIINRCPRIHRDDLPKVAAAGDVTKDCRRIADPNDPNGLYVVRDNPFPPLGCETDRILWALDHLGMHHVAADGMSVWLAGQQKDGSLTLNSGMERAHKIGALQILWVMAEHYRLTGDKEWLKKEAPRLKAAADWILERRKATMKESLTPQELAGIKAGTFSPYGLQPKVAMGDGDPSGSRYYYWADAGGYQSVKLFGEEIADIDPKLGAQYAAEAEKYRKDILPVLNESIVLSPVIRVRDGTARSFHPQGFQDRGPRAWLEPESVNIYSHCGPYHGDYCVTAAAIEAWLRAGVLSIDDPRLDGHFDVLEDVFLLDHPWVRRRKADYDPDRDWFNFGWAYQSGWERLPEFYLLKDDVPNFLRSWLNRCAVDLNLSNWTFNEHTTFAANDKSHGYSVFLSNFRNMLAMEIGDALWLARATPRAWLEQGKKISVKNAPTHFGTLAYEIVSDADNGKINATVEMPARKAPGSVMLRFRHPKSAPIKSVAVNGKEWRDFDKEKEAITLKGQTGTVAVQAQY